jgi:hypothetical protein
MIVDLITKRRKKLTLIRCDRPIGEAVPGVRVNALIVYDLAKRAERHGDPYENLEAMYQIAEVSWAKGDYELFRHGQKPTG